MGSRYEEKYGQQDLQTLTYQIYLYRDF